eukprot:scaffold1110_cov399-Pavlova_lutheri.AAC.8
MLHPAKTRRISIQIWRLSEGLGRLGLRNSTRGSRGNGCIPGPCKRLSSGAWKVQQSHDDSSCARGKFLHGNSYLSTPVESMVFFVLLLLLYFSVPVLRIRKQESEPKTLFSLAKAGQRRGLLFARSYESCHNRLAKAYTNSKETTAQGKGHLQ